MRVRVRFAPSPTGRLHVGNARTALINWLFARRHQGDFVLRLDDTDLARSDECLERRIADDLAWLGLIPDEGPFSGGPHGPYRQSERLSLYHEAAGRLRAQGLAYPCYCTDEDLARERALALARGRAPRYSGRCARLSDHECMEMERQGRVASLRFAVGRGKVAFDDIIKGPMEFDAALIGDFVLLRSSGLPAYNFATVVDDAAMKMTHIIRGDDHLANTARQCLLYQALGFFEPPRFAHHSLLMAPGGGKLSKRAGDLEIGSLESHFLPQAVVAYMAGIGGAAEGGQECLSAPELAARFDLAKAGRSAAVYDQERLSALNAAWIRHLPAADLAKIVRARLSAAGRPVEDRDPAWLLDLAEALRPNLRTLDEISSLGEIFFEARPPRDEWAESVLGESRAREAVAAFADQIRRGVDYREAAARLREQGFSGRGLYGPLRAALTGRRSGPELDAVFHLLGSDAVLERLAVEVT
ncbi:MAG: glutamate--tRNA ligase [Pseudomonadota bacterium]